MLWYCKMGYFRNFAIFLFAKICASQCNFDGGFFVTMYGLNIQKDHPWSLLIIN